jgi:FkbM family methyltransferase
LRKLSHANQLRQIFTEHQIDRVIDVGANLGQFHDFLRNNVGFAGRIESFEPVPELANELKKKASKLDALWTIHACALGSEIGQKSINITASTVFSSFRDPIRTGSIQDSMSTVVSTVAVPIRTLDSQFSTANDLARTYLKLDTQGFDLEVLQGGTRTIRQVAALQTEVSFRPFYSNMPTYIKSIEAFESLGFAVMDFILVAADDNRRAMEFDCLMVRTEGNLLQ